MARRTPPSASSSSALPLRRGRPGRTAGTCDWAALRAGWHGRHRRRFRRSDRSRTIAKRSSRPRHLRPNRPATPASDDRRVSPHCRRVRSSDQSGREQLTHNQIALQTDTTSIAQPGRVAPAMKVDTMYVACRSASGEPSRPRRPPRRRHRRPRHLQRPHHRDRHRLLPPPLHPTTPNTWGQVNRRVGPIRVDIPSRKIAEGNGRLGALRCLKRRVTDAVWRQLQVDREDDQTQDDTWPRRPSTRHREPLYRSSATLRMDGKPMCPRPTPVQSRRRVRGVAAMKNQPRRASRQCGRLTPTAVLVCPPRKTLDWQTPHDVFATLRATTA